MAAIGGRSRKRYDDDDRRGRRSGGPGCLWYALIFLIVMLILSLMFGGFHKGHLHPNGLRAPSGRIAPIPAALI
ncbi:MAG: hypothetical protein HOW97_28675 [Catenulispora sp.]|nr:hypothetical protein [Catenulispora sp.]